MNRHAEISLRASPQRQGLFVVSLDFELHWGIRDKRSVQEYRSNLLGARAAVPAILRLFERYAIRATWAAVGFLFFDGRAELEANLPDALPSYHHRRYSPYSELAALGRNEEEDPFHFAPSLLREIARTPGQELATHTFSHYYCLEPGHSAATFDADLKAAADAAHRLGVQLQSIVFPRNQVNVEYLPICAKHGIRAYRGTQEFVAYAARSQESESLFMRATRLADTYVPVSGHNTFGFERLGQTPPYNVPASFFLRPHSTRLASLDSFRLQRILRDLTHAAKRRETYHLWWHPHNFGTHLRPNLDFLERVIAHVAELSLKYGMQSVGMAELADHFESTLKQAAS